MSNIKKQQERERGDLGTYCKTYHRAHIITHSSEVERKHSEKVEKLPKSVHVSAEDLLSISSSNLTLKKCNLVQPNISSLANLYINKWISSLSSQHGKPELLFHKVSPTAYPFRDVFKRIRKGNKWGRDKQKYKVLEFSNLQKEKRWHFL